MTCNSYSRILCLVIASTLVLQIAATGYQPDPTHRFDHKKDLEKLLHPNNEMYKVHHVQSMQNIKRAKKQDGNEEDDFISSGKYGKVKHVARKGYVHVMPQVKDMQSVVTKILETSETVERQSVVDLKDRK